jgi:hypothetical protein
MHFLQDGRKGSLKGKSTWAAAIHPREKTRRRS